ncbi:MAG: Nif11-like leader peptide family RiPP precursor [Treponema sp.]|nr:Nif11-like leader peptide family RiPP precursor [Treponema sp.]
MNYADFKKKAKEDKAFAEKFKGVKDVDALVKAAAAEGYTFTADDVKSEKLTLGDLDNVAGGSIIGTSDWFVTGSIIITSK